MAKKVQQDAVLLEEARLAEQRSAEALQRRIRARELLEQYEPVVYRMLDQALRENNVSHAYLFQGPKGCLKTEAAILFAQSIFCEAGGLIHEEKLSHDQAQTARRIAERNYGDLLFLDGYRKEAISMDEVASLQSLFSRTSIEKSDNKVYILDHAENSSIGAMNSLLKFLEEPTENVFAVLTVDNVERILPTILSRCVVLPFRALSKEVYETLMRDEGLDEEDIYLLKNICNTTFGFADIAAGRAYQTAKNMLKQFIGAQGDPRLFLVDYEVRYRLRPKDMDGDDKTSSARDANLDVLMMFFGMLIGFYKDVIRRASDGPAWYSNAVRNAYIKEKVNYAVLAGIVVEERDRVNRNNDLNLLLAQAVYRLEAAAL